jgi:hypothetical protein
MWSKVLDEARKGNLEALKAVGHTQEADKHPVCQKLLAYIGPGKKGAEIRDNFDAPPFGWPRDAIDGALVRLAGRRPHQGQRRGGQAVDAKSLDRAKLTQASFQRESVNITPPQLIKIRALFSAVGVPLPAQGRTGQGAGTAGQAARPGIQGWRRCSGT